MAGSLAAEDVRGTSCSATLGSLSGARSFPYTSAMKIYTRTGDDGTTGLLGPGRVGKHEPRVEAFGAVDELNASLGVARALDTSRWLDAELPAIQSRLFNLGAELATVEPDALARLERVSEEDVFALENWIDARELDLPPLRRFILPAGSPLAAELHRARTVCRRAERRVVALAQQESIEPRLLHYLNRLGDLLFVLARWCNRQTGGHEIEWTGSRAGR
jgi:cob(I)alamin adenosyltransferase